MIHIVVPTYNEAANIRVLIPKIHNALQGRPYKVIIVDDNSPDGTAGIAEDLGRSYSVHVIRRPGKLGLGTAYVAGLLHAVEQGSELAFTMDADLSHDPAALPLFIEASKKHDVVVGSRYIAGGGIPNWEWHRRVMSWSGNILARSLLGLKPHDVTTGYRCYKPHILNKIRLHTIRNSGYAFLEEVLFRCARHDASIGEVPIVFRERAGGKSKLGKKEIVKFLLTLFRLAILRK
jgi:dolichol-phosphate mannosyltransferase